MLLILKTAVIVLVQFELRREAQLSPIDRIGYNIRDYTVVQKTGPTKFSNNFNKYWPISIIFVLEIYKVSPILHLKTANFDETRYQLRLIPQQPFRLRRVKKNPDPAYTHLSD